jgi:hypothetical protein
MNDPLSILPEDLAAAPSPLDAVVGPAAQRRFLEGMRFPISCSGSSGTTRSPQLRRLSGTDGYETVVRFLAHYVALVLPDPVATEGSFWAMETVIDSHAPVEEPQQLVRLRVHGVAVATVVEDPDGDGDTPLVCLALAPAPVVGSAWSPEPAYLDVDGAPAPAQQAEGTAEDLSLALLTDPTLLAAGRRATLGLMRLGPVGSARHERDLADVVFTALTGTESLATSG